MFRKKRIVQNVTGDVDNINLLESLLSNFTSVYCVDFENKTIKPYKQDEASQKRFSMFKQGSCLFDDAMSFYIENEIHPDDRQMVRDFVNLEDIRSLLSKGKVASIEYKVIYKGSVYYVYMRFLNFVNDDSNKKAILLFRNITEEVIRRQKTLQEIYEKERIIEMLSAEYESIYKVNLTNQTFSAIRYPDYLKDFKNILERGESLFSSLEKYIKKYVFADDVKKMLELTNPAKVREVLKEKNSFVVTFRDTASGKIQNLELRVFRVFSGKDYTLIAGFINRDAENFLEIESKDIARKAMICNLGEDYDCIASISVAENSAIIAHLSPEFAEYIDGIYKIDDYRAIFEKLSEIFVIPADKEFYYEQCKKENIIKALENNPSYYVTYRVRIKGKEYPYQAKFTYDKADKNKVIVGFHKIV